MTFPTFILQRDGSNITITAQNRDGKPMRVWRSDEHNTEIELIDTVDGDEFQESGVDSNVAYVIQYGEFELSLRLVEDFSDETPAYYVVEPVGDTTFTESSFQIHPSWENDPITIDTVIVDPLQFGVKSSRKYTKQ